MPLMITVSAMRCLLSVAAIRHVSRLCSFKRPQPPVTARFRLPVETDAGPVAPLLIRIEQLPSDPGGDGLRDGEQFHTDVGAVRNVGERDEIAIVHGLPASDVARAMGLAARLVDVERLATLITAQALAGVGLFI